MLGFIERSRCQFYRNGSWHASKQAQEHLRDKYTILAAKDQINTNEGFIEKVATTSSLTGKAYLVRCSDGIDLSASQWLREELHRHRASAAPRAPRGAAIGLVVPVIMFRHAFYSLRVRLFHKMP